MTAIVKMYSTTNSRLNQLQVVDGQLIFVKDTKKIYLDLNGIRVCYDAIQIFNTEQDRLGLLAPVEGFYWVEDTSVMWRYKNGWVQITPSNLDPLFFGELEDFPAIGNSKTLYIAKDATYKWDILSQSYEIIATKQIWESLGE